MRPRKSTGHGLWSGLRFTVNAQDIPSYVKVVSGVVVSISAFGARMSLSHRRVVYHQPHSSFAPQVIIGDPSGFPYENDLSVSKGEFGSIGVWGDTTRATPRLRTFSASKRSCLFPREKRILHREYLRQNCIANCYRKFVQSNCHCSLDFIYYQIKVSNGEIAAAGSNQVAYTDPARVSVKKTGGCVGGKRGFKLDS